MPRPNPVDFIDFETTAIAPRPDYPPRPVGVAIRRAGQRKSRYLAWGHPTGNNCTVEDAKRALAEVWESGHDISMHNAKFDLDVAQTAFGLALPPWYRVHDTMILAYLNDPHAKRIGLKELAEQHLGILPTERDEVREWLVTNGVTSRADKKGWGAHIAEAPGNIVGRYAIGDTDRTKLVFENLLPAVQEAGMQGAYDRERQLVPLLLENEQQGVVVELDRLREDVAIYKRALEDVSRRIFKLLGREVNLDSGKEVADALDQKYQGIQWPLTEKGARSTSKEALGIVLAHRPPLLYALFVYHASVTTCWRNFMAPWLEVAEKTGGRIHTQWNSVAQPEGGGTRTGRLSSSPNFQNIPTLKSPNFQSAIALWEKHLKKLGLPPMPLVRSYIVADDKDSVLLDRDFSQQELRVLAHFEDGEMLQAYRENPRMDLHTYAAEVISTATGLVLTRKETKLIAFGLLYGMGLGSLAEKLGVTVEEARRAKSSYLNTFPGIKDIQRSLEDIALTGKTMRTWGGRVYRAEAPKWSEKFNRQQTFGYKLFNYLVQGSSADITKEAMLRYEAIKKHGRLVLTVHDQIVVSCPKKVWKAEMAILKEAMEGIALDVPLLSDGGVGRRWTELEKCA